MCEIKQFPERERTQIEKLEDNGSKTYRIKLTCAELEFIRNMLEGLTPFLERLDMFEDTKYLFEIGLEKIYPDELAEKIFKQFYDEDGEYR